jgi:peptide/nickel transport system substrate-binding protein
VNHVISVETPSSQEVIVTLDRTSYWYLHNIGGLPIFPAHLLRNVKDWKSWRPERLNNPNGPKLTQLIGTGPFIFTEYKPGEFVHLIRYDGYWKR